MAIIEAKGLFSGDRLSRCSDEAQLHWVRLYSAANGFARLELNYRKLVAFAYSGFKRPPSEAKFWAWIQEYREHFLLFVYKAPSGTVWGQWSTDVRHLPRYKTAEDKRSPSPPPREMKEFEIGYSKWKQVTERPAAILENIPTCSANCAEGKKKSAPRMSKEPGPLTPGMDDAVIAQTDPEKIPSLVNKIVCAHPKSRLRNLKEREVKQGQQVAVLAAMVDEMGQGVTEADALAMMLERTEMLAEQVPRAQWRFFKDVVGFFRDHDYRLEPDQWAKEGSNGRSNASVGRGAAVGRVERGLESLRQAAQESGDHSVRDDDGGDDSVLPPSGDPGSDGETVSDGVPADGPDARHKPAEGGAAGHSQGTGPEILPPSKRSKRGA